MKCGKLLGSTLIIVALQALQSQLGLAAAAAPQSASAPALNLAPDPLNAPVLDLSGQQHRLVVNPAADVAPPPAPGGWVWSITPRLWYLWENDAFFQDTNPGFQQSNEVIDYPFYGGSISVTPGVDEPTYSLTILYGSGNGKFRGVKGSIPPEFWDGDVSVQRFDTEGIAQIPVAEGASLVVGGRYIHFRRKENDTITGNPITVFAENELEQDFFLGELGLGLSRPVTDDGRFIFFGNLTGMLGYADVTKASATVGIFNLKEGQLQGGVFGVDTNAGVGYKLTDNILWTARYRLFYLSAPDFAFSTGATFMHGPEVDLTFSF